MRQILLIFLIHLFCATLVAQKTIRYDLFVRDTSVNYTGKLKRAIAVNGQIPMPTLTFTEGDTAEIYVHNELDEETSMHWHGLLVPNQEDGVPYLTQMPIKPHSTHKYKFPVVQHGTHWYYSHSGFQMQIGMYGSLIIHKRNDDPRIRKHIDELPAIPVVLSDWTEQRPKSIYRQTHNTDWFSIKKGTTQSYSEAIKAGYFRSKCMSEWKRMGAVEVSDVYYSKCLINGKNEIQYSQFSTVKKVRLRISNASISTYFWLRYAGGKITVVASDGNDVEPVEVDRLLIAVGETYDLILTIPDGNVAYELQSTSEDRINSASLWLGSGAKQHVSALPALNYFEGIKLLNSKVDMQGDLDDKGKRTTRNDLNAIMYPEITGKYGKRKGRPDSNALAPIVTLQYAMLKSPAKTNLSPTAPVKEFKLELTGNSNRYVWSFDNKVVSETYNIWIKKNENVRMIIYNNTTMRHSMHLHGHTIRLRNGQGDYAPLKSVVDIKPMETDTLEFTATTDGDWLFHSQNLYRAMSGMRRVFSYEFKPPNHLITNARLARRKFYSGDRRFHLTIKNDFATNGNEGTAMLQNARWSVGREWRLGYDITQGYETEAHLGRYIGKMQWLMPFIGFDWRRRRVEYTTAEKNMLGQASTKDRRTQLSLGVNYTLPMLVVVQALVYQDRVVRFQLMRKDIPVSKRLRAGFVVNTDKEFVVDLRYVVSRNMGIRAHYDSDMGIGIGLSLNY